MILSKSKGNDSNMQHIHFDQNKMLNRLYVWENFCLAVQPGIILILQIIDGSVAVFYSDKHGCRLLLGGGLVLGGGVPDVDGGVDGVFGFVGGVDCVGQFALNGKTDILIVRGEVPGYKYNIYKDRE